MLFKVILSFVLIKQIICNEFIASIGNDVKTTSGVIRGKTIKYENQTIDEYLGIPYAEPPIGKLRFTKPKPLEKPIEVLISQ